MGLFHILKVTLVFFGSIISIFNGRSFDEAIGSIFLSILRSFSDWFTRFDDVFNFFWEFGRYDHPGWAIFCSIILFFIYVVYAD